ncbi:MAG: preprotein translocase subunit SecE [Acidobacteriaceae bacterium]|nr:preprotein translocase subunit SecE [Acidobacteriaceae bacterium]
MSNAVVETQDTGVAEQTLSGPQRLMQFLRDTRSEMDKVVTPTREEVKTGTIVVIATVFIFAAYFELVDLVIGKGIDRLFVHATK